MIDDLWPPTVRPLISNACPNLAVRVGNTQSNISTPSAVKTIRSNAYPTPILINILEITHHLSHRWLPFSDFGAFLNEYLRNIWVCPRVIMALNCE